MSRIKFALNERLTALLEARLLVGPESIDKALRNRQVEIKRALEGGVVSLELISHLRDGEPMHLLELLRGSRLVFPNARRINDETIDSVREAKELVENREYGRMVGRRARDQAEEAASEWRAVMDELTMLLNGLYSVVGSGGAVFVFTRIVAGWPLELCLLLATLSALLVTVAELFMATKAGQRR